MLFPSGEEIESMIRTGALKAAVWSALALGLTQGAKSTGGGKLEIDGELVKIQAPDKEEVFRLRWEIEPQLRNGPMFGSDGSYAHTMVSATADGRNDEAIRVLDQLLAQKRWGETDTLAVMFEDFEVTRTPELEKRLLEARELGVFVVFCRYEAGVLA